MATSATINTVILEILSRFSDGLVIDFIAPRWVQTLSKAPAQPHEIEALQAGYGNGAFVVVALVTGVGIFTPGHAGVLAFYQRH